MSEEFKKKLSERAARIGVVGLGYVGVPLCLQFARKGFKVIALDEDEWRVAQFNSGSSYLATLRSEEVREARSRGACATRDWCELKFCDAIILCLPTPLNVHRDPDLGALRSAVACLKNVVRSGQVISLESTTYPGTTEELVVACVVEAGLRPGIDVSVVYSPEREDPGNQSFDIANVPKVVGGYTAGCLENGCALYRSIVDEVVPLSSLRAAELTKLLENIHRAVNIGLVNEMKIIADALDVDIFEVINAAATKPFGFVPYYPGPGLGGHCIPVDPFYLTWKMREFGLQTRFIEAAGEINSAMPHWVVGQLLKALNESGKAARGSTVLIMGVAYKKNVDDVRESPAIEIVRRLSGLGVTCELCDPFVMNSKAADVFDGHDFVLLGEVEYGAYDAVLLVTDHDQFDYARIKKDSILILDSRGRYSRDEPNVVRA